MKLKLLFVCALAAVLPAQAAFTSTVSASSRGYALVRAGVDSQDNSSPTWVFDTHASFASAADAAYQNHLGIQNTGGASASAHAVPGGLHVTAFAHGTSIGSGMLPKPSNWQAAGSAGAEASSSDGLVFNIDGLPAHTLVTVSFAVNLSGVLDWQSLGVTASLGTRTSGEAGWWVELAGQGSGNTASLYTESGVVTDQRPLAGGVIAGSAVVSLGDIVPLTMRLNAATTASAVGRCAVDLCDVGQVESSSLADFGHTLGWGGVSALHDSNGDPIDLARLRLTSDSGFDYTTAYVSAVPEPASWLLLLAGAGLLSALRRSRWAGCS